MGPYAVIYVQTSLGGRERPQIGIVHADDALPEANRKAIYTERAHAQAFADKWNRANHKGEPFYMVAQANLVADIEKATVTTTTITNITKKEGVL
jgi:hypothetical protein